MNKWIKIKGYESTYEVCRSGKVRNLKTNRKLRGAPNNIGYVIVGLNNNGHQKSHYVHRLVALNFIENPNNYKEVNHKDGNKLNNSVDNLEWCTHKYNISEAMRIGRIGKSKLNYNKAIIIRILFDCGYKVKELAEHYNVDKSSIYLIINNKTWII